MITEGKYGTYKWFGFLMISPHVTESRQDSNHCIPVFFSGTWVLFQSLVGFRIPLAKVSRIPESGFPYMGQMID